MARIVALSTSDNPYNPIEDYDNWFRFDSVEHDYHTDCYLARRVRLSDELSDADTEAEYERAIDQIVSVNVLGMTTNNAVKYVKVIGTE